MLYNFDWLIWYASALFWGSLSLIFIICVTYTVIHYLKANKRSHYVERQVK